MPESDSPFLEGTYLIRSEFPPTSLSCRTEVTTQEVVGVQSQLLKTQEPYFCHRPKRPGTSVPSRVVHKVSKILRIVRVLGVLKTVTSHESKKFTSMVSYTSSTFVLYCRSFPFGFVLGKGRW